MVEVKEIKFTPNIGDNDYTFKMRNARKFLSEGNKVKFTIRFRGREMSYQDLGAYFNKINFKKEIFHVKSLAQY